LNDKTFAQSLEKFSKELTVKIDGKQGKNKFDEKNENAN